jgi:predicted Holliday junction resolvase-like endonuclease
MFHSLSTLLSIPNYLSGAQTLTGQLKVAEQAKDKIAKENQELLQKLKDLENQLQDVRRQSVRKDRDILVRVQKLSHFVFICCN